MEGVPDTQRLDLPADAASVSRARAFVRRVLVDWELEDLVETVALLTSELATNAVLHARTDFAVLLTREAEDVRVDVLDRSAVQPQRRHNSLEAATGRGVALIDRLASGWGSTALLHGYAKSVWFTVPLVGTAESAWGDWTVDL